MYKLRVSETNFKLHTRCSLVMKSVGHATRFMYVINIFFRDLLQGLLLIYKEFKGIKLLFPLE